MAKVTVIVQKDGEEVARFDGVEGSILEQGDHVAGVLVRQAKAEPMELAVVRLGRRLLDAYPKSQTTAIRGV
jgi:hypothetical protein